MAERERPPDHKIITVQLNQQAENAVIALAIAASFVSCSCAAIFYNLREPLIAFANALSRLPKAPGAP